MSARRLDLDDLGLLAAIGEAARRLEALLNHLEEQLERGRSAEAAAEADAARDGRQRLADRGR